MKKSIYIAFSLTVLVFSLTAINSCTEKIPFTSKVKKDYNLKDNQLRELQFQLVNDIVLTKSTSENTSTLENGEIIVSESSSQDKVIFKAGIKGVFVKSIDSTKIAISFEKDDEHYLTFGAKNNTGIYVLTADEWTPQGKGKITYGGDLFISSPESNKAYVTIKLRKSNRNITNQRLATGRKI
jgi:hypothetical protein